MDLHALLEEAERFSEIADAKLVLGFCSGASILDPEVEPLLVAFGVCIHLDVQIIALYHLFFVHNAPLDVCLAQMLGFDPFEVPTLYHRGELQLI